MKLKELFESDDASQKLSFDQQKEIEKFIRDVAKDTKVSVPHAIFLTLASYKNINLDKPSITDDEAWEQYCKNIEYAVDQLSKYRGADGDWRLTIPFKTD